jgi:CDP-diacylglycerol--serine O-phosphatidyltransferase
MKLMRRAEDREHAGRDRRMRRGLYILPSLFTAGNIGLGYYAITQALQGSIDKPSHFAYSAIAIGFAAVFDGLDGLVARMTKTESDFGKELDSLADVITFGVAPAILAYTWGFRNLPWLENPALQTAQTKIIQAGAIATFLFLIAGASRLARFNIAKNPQPTNPGRPGRKYFVGMPIPAGAGVIASVVFATDGAPIFNWWLAACWMTLVTFVGFLMVSRWRFFSLKNVDLHRRRSFRVAILVIAAICTGIAIFPQVVLLALAFSYMISGILSRASYFVTRRHQPAAEGSAEEQQANEGSSPESHAGTA